MKQRRKAVVIAALLLLLIGVLIVVMVNPFNWGVSRSPRFSLSRFAQIQCGMKIEQVTGLLGPPIRVVNDIAPPLCPAPARCRNFIFADNPQPWVLAYKKAWVIVDEHDRVVNALTYAEP